MRLLEHTKLFLAIMPVATLTAPKGILNETTDANRNISAASFNSAKRRKLDPPSSSPIAGVPRLSQGGGGPNNKFKLGSSQPKSHFESEVLEKLTQDIGGLKEANAEKDQQWERLPLTDFEPTRDSLCFQQIDVEEGTLRGDRTTVKLFGVTEVRARAPALSIHPPSDKVLSADVMSFVHRKGTRSCYTSRTSSNTFTLPRRCPL